MTYVSVWTNQGRLAEDLRHSPRQTRCWWLLVVLWLLAGLLSPSSSQKGAVLGLLIGQAFGEASPQNFHFGTCRLSGDCYGSAFVDVPWILDNFPVSVWLVRRFDLQK